MKKKRIKESRAETAETMLRAIMRETGPEGRLPTISKLCSMLQISLGTLDRVLERLEREGLVLRQRGRGLFVTAAISRKTVALVFGRGYAKGFPPFWLQLESDCRKHVTATGDRFRFYVDQWSDSPETPSHSELDMALHAHEIDGLIVGAPNNIEQMVWLQSQKLPLVALTNTGENPCRVTFNNDLLIQYAVETMVARKTRHAIILAPMGIATAPLESLLLERGIAFTAAELDYTSDSTDPMRESPTIEEHGYRAMRNLLARGLDADTVVSLDDMMTRGALMAIAQAGLTIGKDLTVITHANRNTSTLAPYDRNLILIEFDPEQFAVTAVDMLERLMMGRTPSRPIIRIDPKVLSGNR